MIIGVYAIAKNEEANVADWLATTAAADVRVFVDTGSTDRTIDLIRAAEAECDNLRVVEKQFDPWRFDDAWNAALDELPDDVDWCVRVALDVRLPEGWRRAISRRKPLGMHAVLQPWFAHGEPPLEYRHSLIHSRLGVRWYGSVHEVLLGALHRADIEITMTHSNDGQHHGMVLAMLEAEHAANPDDLHVLHYYGRELMYEERWAEAIEVLRRHATSDAFAEERSESWRYIGDCYFASMPIDEVPLGPYRLAAETCPQRREGFVSLADLCRQQRLWRECGEAAAAALAITEKSWYFNWAYAWGPMPEDCRALAAWNLGHKATARKHGKRAAALAPDDERLADNVKTWYEPSA